MPPEDRATLKIGVFDSGIGGLSVAQAIREALPGNEVVLREDKTHVPYGSRKPQEILGFILPIFQELVDAGCQVIVVACNTVSTTLIEDLRQHFKVPLIAVEPMVKAAAEFTKSKVIAIYATPTTLASQRYGWLKSTYASGLTILEPDCSDWAFMIEHQQVDQQRIVERTNEILAAGADVIVLGCTHYHWIEQEITDLSAGRATVLQPEPSIIKELKRVIAQLR